MFNIQGQCRFWNRFWDLWIETWISLLKQLLKKRMFIESVKGKEKLFFHEGMENLQNFEDEQENVDACFKFIYLLCTLGTI